MNPPLNAATAPHANLTHHLDALTPGIVHLGLGNFHRAHQATYTAAALAVEPGPWGIIGAASRSRRVVDAMRAQDLLYTVTEISPSGTAFHIPAVHTEVLVASEETERLIGALADSRTRIISLTVTESGYTFDPETGSLDVAHPDVQSDLRLNSPPRTPREIEEAARVDGCRPLGILTRINVPLIAPSLAATAVIAFFSAWNEYVFALTFIFDRGLQPASVGLASFIGELSTPTQTVMAVAVMYTLPAVAFYLIAQRYIVTGMTAGSVKG